MNATLREQNRSELAELCQTSALRINYITVFLQAVGRRKNSQVIAGSRSSEPRSSLRCAPWRCQIHVRPALER
jgi:hypothetical protein